MWFWIVIAACVVGAIIGLLNSDSDNKGANAAGGAITGGCMAAGCITRIAITALVIIGILWLFGLLFG